MKINNHFKDQTKFFRYGTFHNVPDSYIQSPNENNSFNDNQRAVVPCYNPTPQPPKSNNFFMEQETKIRRMVQKAQDYKKKFGGAGAKFTKNVQVYRKSGLVQVQGY